MSYNIQIQRDLQAGYDSHYGNVMVKRKIGNIRVWFLAEKRPNIFSRSAIAKDNLKAAHMSVITNNMKFLILVKSRISYYIHSA